MLFYTGMRSFLCWLYPLLRALKIKGPQVTILPLRVLSYMHAATAAGANKDLQFQVIYLYLYKLT